MIDILDENAMSKAIRNDPKFEKVLQEYKIVIQQLKIKCVNKYGDRAADWFGI